MLPCGSRQGVAGREAATQERGPPRRGRGKDAGGTRSCASVGAEVRGHAGAWPSRRGDFAITSLKIGR